MFEPMAPVAGRPTIGPYTIASLLGAGGMGEVYRARDMKLGRDVAIKVLPAEFTADAGRRARFEREARLLAALNHPHIAQSTGSKRRTGCRRSSWSWCEARRSQRLAAPGPTQPSEPLSTAMR